uniref:Integrase, catalytic region, zinc finger, CCHC-type, peptidase aspartic, catalytic n=1 Tax=Tanacetum cinerariifolium TaxID=118510 RepID=A0A6L2LXH4_TANCI|nr:hypothetical protein [Tanacetum cinerariifolium]
MKLYIENRENERKILNSVVNGTLVWPTIDEENGTNRIKKSCCLMFSQRDDPITCLNKAMAFLSVVGVSRQAAQKTILNTATFQTRDLDTYDSDCNDVSNAKAFLMTNLSNYGSEVILEAAIQDTNLYAQQDSMILPMIEQMSKQMINHVNNWEKANQEKNNESLTTELEIYKEQTRALSKERYDSFIAQLNTKSMENANLKGQIQEKVFVTTTFPNELKDPLAPRLLKNRDAHIDYLKYTQEQADILQRTVEQDTCPTMNKPKNKLVAVTPMNKVKKVKFFKPLTSSSNIHKQVESSKTPDSNTLVLPSTRLKSSTSASRSQPTCNKKNDRISQTPSNNMKNKVKVQLRRANLSSNKKNSVKDPIFDANVKHAMLNANSDLIVLNVNNKPTGKLFTDVGYKWKPIGRLLTLVCNACPLTRITSTKVVPIKETTSHSVETQQPEIKVYKRRPKQVKSKALSKKSKIVECKIANNSEPNHS